MQQDIQEEAKIGKQIFWSQPEPKKDTQSPPFSNAQNLQEKQQKEAVFIFWFEVNQIRP